MKANEAPQQYIPKSTLVMEIEKLKRKIDDHDDYANGWHNALSSVETDINFLEVKEGKDWKEEPVSESIDFEQELYKAFGQIKDFTLGVAIAKRFYNMGRKHNEPVSDELEEAAVEWFNSVKYKSDLSGTPINAFKTGSKWQIARLMKDATEVIVAVDAGGYPYVDKHIELYDYDKDIPLAKEGDKYKVVLIKED